MLNCCDGSISVGRKISELLGVSRSTIYRWLQEVGLSVNFTYTNISDADLDHQMEVIKDGDWVFKFSWFRSTYLEHEYEHQFIGSTLKTQPSGTV